MSNETTTTDLVEVDAPTVFEIPAYRYDEFVKRVDKANRRLAKAGGSERFEFTFETFEKQVWRKTIFTPVDGTMEPTGIYEPWFRATLVNDSFRIAAGNHTFVATLIAEEAGYTVHTAPDQSLDGWTRPAVDDIHCDVCGTVRNRINIYIVRDEATGKLIQVGTNCLAPLLGFSPQSLWALTWTSELSDLTEADEDDEESWNGYRGRAERTVGVDRVLAIAWAISSGGVNYTSTKAAEAYAEKTNWERTIPTTVSKIRAHLAGRPRPWKGDDSAGREWDKVQALAEAVTETQILDVKVVGETLQAGTDYADNMHTILAGERVTFRNIGILGSLVSVYAREQDREQERAAKTKVDPIAKGWIGEEKERIRNFSITLTTVKEFERDSFSGYGTETATMILGRTADGHVVKWVYAGTVSYEVGDVITIKAGTVKKQDTWNGIDQTVLNRVVTIDN